MTSCIDTFFFFSLLLGIKTVVLGCAIAILGAALQTASQNVAWMMCARIITGVGTGHL